MAHGFLSLVSLTVLLLARSGFCRFVSKDQTYNSTIEPSPKATVDAGVCSFVPQTTTLYGGDSAEFSTTNYPNNYPRFHSCSWKFQAGPNAKLSVYCPVVQLNWFGVFYVSDGDNTMRESCWVCFPKPFTHSFTSTSAEIALHNTFIFGGKGFTCTMTAISTSPPASDCTCGVPVRSTRIIGGQPTEEHVYPWMVVVLTTKTGGSFFCGGSLINNKFVLTAAHCTYGTSNIIVRLGAHYHYSAEAQEETALGKKEHHLYNKKGKLEYDVAVIEIPTIDFSLVSQTIRPICLPTANNFYVGGIATAAGWGCTQLINSGLSPHLREVELEVWSNTYCESLNLYMDASMMCTSTNKKNICPGDSGGPLFTSSLNGKYVEQIGISSWIINKTTDVYYRGGFARITELKSWIVENTAGSDYCPPPS